MTPRRRLGVVVILPIATLGFALVHPFGNPRNIASEPRATLLQGAKMSAGARNVLLTKCADCHSNTTHWPVYSHTAPVSWLVERDIVEGRKHLNLSHWLELSDDHRETLSAEIVSEAKRGEMPLVQYRLVHWHSNLTPDDVAALLTLTPDEGTTNTSSTGDPVRGKAAFERKCTGCHTLGSNREGPNLRGVYGRKAGTVHDFDYSAPLLKSGLTWNDANLEKWLRDTDEMVPQSAMGFSVPKAQDRADLIAFLKLQ